MKSAPVYISTHWLEPVPGSQCEGHRELIASLSAKKLTLLYQPGIPKRDSTALPQPSQKHPSKTHSTVNPVSSGEGFSALLSTLRWDQAHCHCHHFWSGDPAPLGSRSLSNLHLYRGHKKTISTLLW